MKIEIETGSYNEKRYGKPWIAKVGFSQDPKGSYVFGSFVGDPGYEGMLVIDLNPGDIGAQGQKDHRARRPEPPEYFVVNEDGVRTKLKSKAEAYKTFKSKEQK
jgi:hypothetical protein